MGGEGSEMGSVTRGENINRGPVTFLLKLFATVANKQ